ncbi:toxin-antitoxin system YwqK family antitoxin [Calothrix sp. PCC 7507]|uniref:toxin-antitoxin system YwqK family antitoxin n=1 Tax=Calothrix sp. PCC 7507 TaxID=99598 RepID=UPI00029F3FA7|nr:hypothetical protein [Calothrix sp. PCC 7507]AFY30925.1 hypothetical protein Cal7507_0430 [Calothrix sp. PCC 7507]
MVIPQNAVEEINESWINGLKKSAFYYINQQKVGYRWWDEEGHLSMEYELKGKLMHGSFRTWHDNGMLREESNYFEGKEHGIAKQYDDEGKLIGIYEMHYGTGADLWYESDGILAEERYLKDGNRDGYERWWKSDNKTIFSEQHFKSGVEHGIHRQWNKHGRLRRAFPQYFVNGEKVTKRQYLKICLQDESLPNYVADEDNWQRHLPLSLIRNTI